MKLSHRSVGRSLVACAVLVLLGLPLPVLGQDGGSEGRGHVGLPMDWSFRHVVYTNATSPANAMASWHDPRAVFHALAHGGVKGAGLQGTAVLTDPTVPEDQELLEPFPRGWFRRRPRHREAPVQVDWAVSLAAGNTAVGMFAAKYSFDVTATPDCTNDFVVYTLDIAGSGTQANLVGINNLYSGTSGFCVGSPNVNWAYNTGARNSTSPALSLDGTQIAFVENANPPVFHVLAWQANCGSSCTVTGPATPGAASGTGGRPNAGQMTSLTLTLATGDGLSSPFIDYANDVAYVGTNNGQLFKILNVFCSTTACQTTPVAPTIDATYGNASCGVGCSYFLVGFSGNVTTGPVLNGSNGVLPSEVLIGGSNGYVYRFPVTGNVNPFATWFLQVGDGVSSEANGGVVDPPIVDGTNSLVYATAGCDPTNTFSVLFQAPTDFSSSITANIGHNTSSTACGHSQIHSGAFDNAYFTSPASGHMMVCGQSNGFNANDYLPPVLYQFAFASGTNGPYSLQTTPATTNTTFDTASSNSGSDQCSPLTEFYNANTSADQLYLGVGWSGSTTAAISSFSAATLASVNSDALTGTIGLTGTSGIIVDNIGTGGQEANIYFTGLANGNVAGGSCPAGNTCAFKLSQSALQ